MTRLPSGDFERQAVLAALRWERDRARSIGDIAESLSFTRRQVEKAIQELRLDGKPIASSSDGVWLTGDPAELEVTYRTLRGRIASQALTAWAIRSMARRLRTGRVQQTTLFDEAA